MKITVASALTMATLTSTTSAISNKEIAVNAVTGLFVNLEPNTVDKYLGDVYTQHNPTVPDGKEALRSVIQELKKNPNFKYEIGAVVEQGDLVWNHARVTGWGPQPLAVVDIFRVENNKIVEHWDVMQTYVPDNETASGRPMFPTPFVSGKAPQDERNQQLVVQALTRVFHDHDLSAVDQYFNANKYLQHNPHVADGVQALRDFVTTNPNADYELDSVASEAGLVWLHGRYSKFTNQTTPSIAVDIFRVEDGKIVEHWDILQDEVAAKDSKNGHGMFPIATSTQNKQTSQTKTSPVPNLKTQC